jgi:2-oxoglutarate ferredoxin oxidoreductase subunit beta
VTKSTPFGSLDAPFNPVSLALGAEASFVARTIDSDRKHLTAVLTAAAQHRGSALVEIYQNCNIFNDNAFEHLKAPGEREQHLLRLEAEAPLAYGTHKVVWDGERRGLAVTPDTDPRPALVHDPAAEDPAYAFALSRLQDPATLSPTPIGVFRSVQRPVYEDLMEQQLADAGYGTRAPDLGGLLSGADTWTVEG